MAEVIPLQALANQSLSVNIGENVYDITIKAAQDIMAITIIRDSVTIVEGARIVAQEPIIPYMYLEDGNFIFVPDSVDANNIPFYTEFGSRQFLIFYSQEELDEIRG